MGEGQYMTPRSMKVVLAVFILLASMLFIPLSGAHDNLENTGSAPGIVESATPIHAKKAPDPFTISQRSQSRAINETELMGWTTTPPTIDGVMNVNEWKDAAIYKIGTNPTNNVDMYIMFNETQIFVAVEATTDVTEDTADPSGTQLVNPQGDYFAISFDGEPDGKITYQAILNAQGNPWPGEWPLTGVGGGGDCVDRGAITSGGTKRTAGFWNVHPNGNTNTLFIWEPGDGPNAGTGEPYDYINTTFNTHRYYEYSIPFNGTGDELNLTLGDTVNLVVLVNDGKGGSGAQLIGRMPGNASSISGPPYQTFQLNGKPTAIIEAISPTLYLRGSTVSFDGSSSSDVDGMISAHEWDFNYDGATFVPMASGPTSQYTFNTAGTYTVALRVTDDAGGTVIDTVELTIMNEALPPEISNVTPTSDPAIDESDSITFELEYGDPNLGVDDEQLTITWLLNGNVVKTENATEAGSTSFLFESDFTGEFSSGTYNVKFVVNDSYDAAGLHTTGSMEAVQEWVLTVNNINRGPVIESHTPENLQYITDEETKVEFEITISDPDDDTVKISWYLDEEIVEGATQTTFSILDQPDYLYSGLHTVAVKITDTGEPPISDEVMWTIQVTDVNRFPAIKSSSPTGDVTIREGESEVFQITATDPDTADTLTYKWYIDDSEQIETSDRFIFEADYDDAVGADIELKVTVSDGKDGFVEKIWTISIEDVDRPPVAGIVSPGEGSEFLLSETITFDASRTTDPDGDEITITWNFGDDTGDKTGSIVKHAYILDDGAFTVTATITTKHEGQYYSQPHTINITIKAARIKMTGIVAEPDTGYNGDKITITATFTNEGTIDASDVSAVFLLNGVTLKTVFIGDFAPGETKSASYEWKATTGTYRFIAEIPGSAHDDHTIISVDGLESNTVTIQQKPGGIGNLGEEGGWLIYLIIVILVVCIIGGVVAFAARKKKKEAPEAAEEEAAPAQPQPPAEPAPPPAAPEPQPQPGPVPAPSTPAPQPQPATPAASSPFRQRVAKRAEPKQARKFADPTGITPELAQMAADEGICPCCGDDVEPDWKICMICGYKLVQTKPLAKPGLPPKPAEPTPAPEPAEPEPPKAPEPAPAPVPTPKEDGWTKCPSCGEDVESSWLKCPMCGALVSGKEKPAPAPSTGKCPNCNEEIEPGWSECPMCKHKLK
jgi:hypothetical protein